MSFRNDGQFPVSHALLASILHEYGIEDDFTFRVATGGIENTTCIIEVVDNKYALRIYRHAKKPLAEIELEVAFMNMLGENHILVPQVFPNSSEELITTIMADGKPWQALLMECMPGDHPTHYTPALLKQSAQTQVRMRVLSVQFSKSHTSSDRLSELVEDEFLKRVKVDAFSDKKLLDLIERIRAYRVELDPELPHGYSHFDWELGNILVDQHNNLTAVLDFDDMMDGPYVMCLAYMLRSIFYETSDEHAVLDYLKEYEKVCPLTAQERAYLPAMMLFRHYVNVALKMLNGHTTAKDVDRYVEFEQRIQSMKFDTAR